MTVWTNRAWFTVEEAARLLRVRRNTLYAACAAGDFPCSRWGGTDGAWFIRIPAEALRMQVRPTTQTRNHHLEDHDQMTLDLDPACLIPVRRFRNTREAIEPWSYEHHLWGGKVRRATE